MMHKSERCKHGWSLYSPTPCSECVEEKLKYHDPKDVWPLLGSGDSGDENDYNQRLGMWKPNPAPMLTSEIITGAKPTNPKDALGIKKVPFTTISWPVLAELGVAMLEGALKYGRHNYRTIGVRASVYVDAANRHIASYWEGEDIDPDSGLSHITKAIASLVVLRDAMINDKFTDDRPPRPPAGWMASLNGKVADLLARYPAPVHPYTHADNTWIE